MPLKRILDFDRAISRKHSASIPKVIFEATGYDVMYPYYDGNGRIILACYSDSASVIDIYVSEDYGISWEKRAENISSVQPIVKIERLNNPENYIYISTYGTVNVYSSDDGKTWIKLERNTFGDIYKVIYFNGKYYGIARNSTWLYYSNNFEFSENTYRNLNFETNDLLIYNNSLYVIGRSKYAVSSDGNTWITYDLPSEITYGYGISSGSSDRIVIRKIDNNYYLFPCTLPTPRDTFQGSGIIYLEHMYNPTFISKTQDFTNFTLNLYQGAYILIHSVNSNNVYIARTHPFNTIWKFEDGELKDKLELPKYYVRCGMDTAPPLYTTIDADYFVLRDTLGVNSLLRYNLNTKTIEVLFEGILSYAIAGTSIYVVGTDYSLYASYDYGETWDKLTNLPYSTCYKVFYIKNRIFIIVRNSFNNYEVYYSTDNGAHWTYSFTIDSPNAHLTEYKGYIVAFVYYISKYYYSDYGIEGTWNTVTLSTNIKPIGYILTEGYLWLYCYDLTARNYRLFYTNSPSGEFTEYTLPSGYSLDSPPYNYNDNAIVITCKYQFSQFKFFLKTFLQYDTFTVGKQEDYIELKYPIDYVQEPYFYDVYGNFILEYKDGKFTKIELENQLCGIIYDIKKVNNKYYIFIGNGKGRTIYEYAYPGDICIYSTDNLDTLSNLKLEKVFHNDCLSTTYIDNFIDYPIPYIPELNCFLIPMKSRKYWADYWTTTVRLVKYEL